MLKQYTVSKPAKRMPVIPIGPSIAYIPLTKGKFSVVDAADIEKLSYLNWCVTSQDYAATHGVDGTQLLMHRFLVECPAGFLVDHINRNTLDNRTQNFRISDTSLNCHNKSGVRGVKKSSKWNSWQASIQVRGVRKHLGSFKTEEEAIRAREKAEAEIDFGKPLNAHARGMEHFTGELPPLTISDKGGPISPLRERESQLKFALERVKKLESEVKSLKEAPQPSPEAGEVHGEVKSWYKGRAYEALSGSELPELDVTEADRREAGKTRFVTDTTARQQGSTTERLLSEYLIVRERQLLSTIQDSDFIRKTLTAAADHEKEIRKRVEAQLEVAQKRVAELEGEVTQLRQWTSCAYGGDGIVAYASTPEARDIIKGWHDDSLSLKASQGQDAWVSVEERLPEDFQSVLTVWAGQVQRVAYRLVRDEWVCSDGESDNAPLKAFTHWCPLPSPPSTRENGGGE